MIVAANANQYNTIQVQQQGEQRFCSLLSTPPSLQLFSLPHYNLGLILRVKQVIKLAKWKLETSGSENCQLETVKVVQFSSGEFSHTEEYVTSLSLLDQTKACHVVQCLAETWSRDVLLMQQKQCDITYSFSDKILRRKIDSFLVVE